MSKQSCVASAAPTSEPRVISSKLPPPDVAGHDEWLLDEALAETFPASDPIAVSAYSPVSDETA